MTAGYDEIDDLFKGAVKRDQYGRPLLRSTDGRLLAYTRASSLADTIHDFHGLTIWEKRLIIKGLGEREDLAAMAGALPLLTDDKDLDRPTNRELDEIGRQAFEHSRGHAKANWGTAVHSYTEPGPRGVPPDRMQADVASFSDAMRGLPIVATELFVANDDLMAAGTFDHIVHHPEYGNVVADKKTGQLKFLQAAIQTAVYAGGDLYDVETDERSPLPIDNRDWGLLIHIPVGQGRTDIYKLDLNIGRAAAALCLAVKEMRSRRDVAELVDANEMITKRRRIARELMQGASSLEELRHIWLDFEPVLTDEMKDAFTRRAEQLTTH